MKKQNRKKLDYVNVEHFLVKTSTFSLKEAIVLNMIWKRIEDKKSEFPDSVLFLEKVSGISRHTIKLYIEKFKNLKIINSVGDKYFFLSDYEKYLENLQELDRMKESGLNPQKLYYHSTYTLYHFEVAKHLKLNVAQYFFLDIHIGLFKDKGFGTSPKNYTMRVLGIEERYYFDLKKQLFKKGYLERYDNSDLIKVNDSVIETLGIARSEIKKYNRNVV